MHTLMSSIKLERSECDTFERDEHSEQLSDDVTHSQAVASAMEVTFKEGIRPMLDVVDQIRAQGVTEENIQLPTIVVVGDQSSGKSSVLESLAGITLPRGQGIATRVPLVLRLQSCRPDEKSTITMDYGDKKDQIVDREEEIEAAINAATDVLAGTSKGVKNTPISLHIKKPNAPDLTMVDLPGITRVPVHGQPENIYEQISGMIMQYIIPEESIILNVLSAQVDFPTCESIRMSQQVDKEGKRTLAVVTKVDKAAEGLLAKVTTDAVNIGLGYVCVRNRIDSDDSIAIARVREEELFNSHLSLKDLAKSMVGIPALARKLTRIQADMVKGCLPRIRRQMIEALQKRRQELNNLPKGIKDDDDAGLVFFQVQNKRHRVLEQLVREGNYDLFADDVDLHYTARMHEKYIKFANDLHDAGHKLRDQSQTEEIEKLISEHQGVGLPDFLPHSVLHHLMKKQIVSVTEICTSLVEEAFVYATDVVLRVNTFCSEGYPSMEKCYKEVALEALDDTKKIVMAFVDRILEKESTIIFTTNDHYTATLQKLTTAFENAKQTNSYSGSVALGEGRDTMGLSEIFNQNQEYQDAWRMKVSLVAYWKVVQKRLADEIPLEIRYALQFAIDNLRRPWPGSASDLRSLMEEDPLLASNRSRLQHRVDALTKCLHLLTGLMP